MAVPKVTVLMSVFNEERFLQEALDSILNQTYKDFEFIIINDGSTDKSKEILELYDDKRIRIINNDHNIGLTRSLNLGLELARGEYIARMDANDLSLPTRLEKQVKFLNENTDVVLTGNWTEHIDDNGNSKGVIRYPTEHCFISWNLLTKPCLAHTTVMYRRDKALDVGSYNTTLKYTQDYDLWVRLSKVGKVSQITEVLLKVRLSDDSIRVLFKDNQIEIGRSISYDNVKAIMNELDEHIFSYFYERTKKNNLSYNKVRKIVSLTRDIKGKFTNINKPDQLCRKQIAREIQLWFLIWALKNWKHPLIFTFLLFSILTFD